MRRILPILATGAVCLTAGCDPAETYKPYGQGTGGASDRGYLDRKVGKGRYDIDFYGFDIDFLRTGLRHRAEELCRADGYKGATLSPAVLARASGQSSDLVATTHAKCGSMATDMPVLDAASKRVALDFYRSRRNQIEDFASDYSSDETMLLSIVGQAATASERASLDQQIKRLEALEATGSGAADAVGSTKTASAGSGGGDRCTVTPKCKAATDPVIAMANRLAGTASGYSVHKSAEAAYCMNAAAAQAMKACLAEHTASGDQVCIAADRQGVDQYGRAAADALVTAQSSYGMSGAYSPDCSVY